MTMKDVVTISPRPFLALASILLVLAFLGCGTAQQKSDSPQQGQAAIPAGPGDASYQIVGTTPPAFELQRAGKLFQVASGSNILLFTGDTVKNTGNGLLLLNAPRTDTKIGLKPKTVLEILQDQIQLLVGQTRMKFTKGHSHFQIKIPHAILGIRGTEFEVNVGANGNSTVALYEGNLEVTSETGNKIELNAGNRLMITANGEDVTMQETPLPPESMTTEWAGFRSSILFRQSNPGGTSGNGNPGEGSIPESMPPGENSIPGGTR